MLQCQKCSRRDLIDDDFMHSSLLLILIDIYYRSRAIARRVVCTTDKILTNDYGSLKRTH